MNLEKRRELLLDFLSRVLKGLFIVQIFIFFWFTGAMVRREQSPYMWIEFSRRENRFGTGDALFSAVLYVLYYCFFLEVSWLTLRTFLLREHPTEKRRLIIYRLMICSVWVLSTYLVLADSIFQFVRSLPTDIANGWLVIVWIILTVFAGMAFWRLLDARRKKNRSSSLECRYEQFLARHNLTAQFFEEERSAEE